ncbi:hypothetical protein B0J15DRAFT_14745 [Fusarium solani]|uniref:Uncharacterized protein n=1 Tax=Fusarium solani TaxID=169388 RepID=A0A9P9L5W8_FUSSL|nr:uncharacterized protein B0J15DRAFT_14745 [Fusarium solani]KAH7275400.1 hypothetical protein B0J15DRAFT_14745 [Fusarium solani]
MPANRTRRYLTEVCLAPSRSISLGLGNFLASRSILASVGFLSLSPSNLAFGPSRDRGKLDLVASSFPRRLRAFLSTIRGAPSVLPQSFQLLSYFGALRVPNHPPKLQSTSLSGVVTFTPRLYLLYLGSLSDISCIHSTSPPPWAPTVSPRISSADIDTSKQHSPPLLLHLAAFPSWVVSPWSWLSSSPSSSLVVPLSATQEPSPSQGSQGPRPPLPSRSLSGKASIERLHQEIHCVAPSAPLGSPRSSRLPPRVACSTCCFALLSPASSSVLRPRALRCSTLRCIHPVTT